MTQKRVSGSSKTRDIDSENEPRQLTADETHQTQHVSELSGEIIMNELSREHNVLFLSVNKAKPLSFFHQALNSDQQRSVASQKQFWLYKQALSTSNQVKVLGMILILKSCLV